MELLLEVTKSTEEKSMSKNHPADIKNGNKGTSGQNQTHAQNQGNRGGQLNPTNKSNTKGPKNK